MIHVCYSLRDESGRYSKFAGTSIESLLENTREEVTIHVIHDSTLSRENRKIFRKIVYSHDQEINFHNIEEIFPPSMLRIEERKSLIGLNRNKIAAFYRALIQDILPPEIERAIYIDADTVVNLDISELWSIDLKDFPIAAVVENSATLNLQTYLPNSPPCKLGIVAPEDYFTSGVLVMDLNQLRSFGRGKLFDRCFEIFEQIPNCEALDQDVLNIIFAGKYLKLPGRFNAGVYWFREIDLQQLDSIIYHFWRQANTFDLDDVFNRLWFEYFLKTPFFTMKTLENLSRGIQKSQQDLEAISREIMMLSVDRKRGFFVYPDFVDLVTEYFGQRDDDIFILAEDKKSFEKMAISLLESEGSRIFFIHVLPQDYQIVCDLLERFDLHAHRDFLDVSSFIEDRDIRSKLIKDM